MADLLDNSCFLGSACILTFSSDMRPLYSFTKSYKIAQACKPVTKIMRMWSSVRALARGYEYLMGLIIFAPIAISAWFSFMSEFQTRLLFNQAFSRGLQIQRILTSGKKQK